MLNIVLILLGMILSDGAVHTPKQQNSPHKEGRTSDPDNNQ